MNLKKAQINLIKNLEIRDSDKINLYYLKRKNIKKG
jgi:hypothetical protein